VCIPILTMAVDRHCFSSQRKGSIYRTKAKPAMAMAPRPAIWPLTLGAAAPVKDVAAADAVVEAELKPKAPLVVAVITAAEVVPLALLVEAAAVVAGIMLVQLSPQL